MKKLAIVFMLGLCGHIAPLQAEEVNLRYPEPTIQTGQGGSPLAVDCNVSVSFTMDDGTRLEGELTFVGIPWWECAAIKIGNFLSKIF